MKYMLIVLAASISVIILLFYFLSKIDENEVDEQIFKFAMVIPTAAIGATLVKLLEVLLFS